jgi:hypothetical protein
MVPVDPPPPSNQGRSSKPILMGTMGLAGNSYALMVSEPREPTCAGD